MNVDSFNARAVEQVRAVTEAEEIKVFEAARLTFIDAVKQLSDDDFKDERILTQIKWNWSTTWRTIGLNKMPRMFEVTEA